MICRMNKPILWPLAFFYPQRHIQNIFITFSKPHAVLFRKQGFCIIPVNFSFFVCDYNRLPIVSTSNFIKFTNGFFRGIHSCRLILHKVGKQRRIVKSCPQCMASLSNKAKGI